ncbi:hypothetical protein [Taklimakanibacter lacteus]|uniref:hypothetical protein n=1 Tax=Taklimakanibacter lacteus TaxID=2268456 RepID=UPI000E6729E7
MMLYVWLLTIVHTILSFVAIGVGIKAIVGLFQGAHSNWWTRRFFELALAVTFTGFIFPFAGVTPAFATGIVSAVILIAWFLAHRAHIVGAWRWIYVLAMVASLYLLIFVTIAQAFQKVPFLNALAPTGSEPPFAIAQAIALVIFIVIGTLAVRRFRPAGAVRV